MPVTAIPRLSEYVRGRGGRSRIGAVTDSWDRKSQPYPGGSAPSAGARRRTVGPRSQPPVFRSYELWYQDVPRRVVSLVVDICPSSGSNPPTTLCDAGGASLATPRFVWIIYLIGP